MDAMLNDYAYTYQVCSALNPTLPLVPMHTLKLLSNQRLWPLPCNICCPNVSSFSGCAKSNSYGRSSNDTTNAALSIVNNDDRLIPKNK